MDNIYNEHQEKMQKTLTNLENEFSAMKAGRANPAVLDKVRVDYYGTPTPINQVATVSVPEPTMLAIQPWDQSLVKEIVKAIQTSDIGINPAEDGKVIRLAFPPLTEERRKDMGKTIRKYAEEAKVSIRGVRRDAIEKYKKQQKNSEITEDDLKEAEKKIQELTDDFCKKIDNAAQSKEKEIMSL
jgi:ribosome recycling factor